MLLDIIITKRLIVVYIYTHTLFNLLVMCCHILTVVGGLKLLFKRGEEWHVNRQKAWA